MLQLGSCAPQTRTSEAELGFLGTADLNGVAQPALPDCFTYLDYFSLRAARSGRKVAARFEGRELTYAELSRRSARLAHQLQPLGVGPETLVAVCLERSLELLVALLAVWKAGGAYLPLDPEYPQARLAFMLADSRAALLLTSRPLQARIGLRHDRTFLVEDSSVKLPSNGSGAEEPQSRARPDNLAYVIYTSGSTGNPKGVAVTHRSLLNHNLAVARAYRLHPQDVVLQFAPTSFDVSIEEIFPSWLKGCTVVLRTKQAIASIPYFLEFVAQERISVLNLPTAFWHQLVDSLTATPLPPSTRLVVIGGEQASVAHYHKWKKAVNGSIKLINSYGPTESTITATVFEAGPADETLPIGRPLPNLEALVLDERLEPVPAGATGELYLGGAGLARGYLHQPKLTAERFLPNSRASLTSGERIYKTGDLVRLRPDGNLEFMGRSDHQLKIRGYRVEPAEIETALMDCPGIKAAAVVGREDLSGNKYLAAYCVPEPEKAPTSSWLLGFLRGRLPEHMIPSKFVLLAELPLTAAGKVDRLGLPEPGQARPELKTEYVAPRNGVEDQLTRIWCEVLELERVGVQDDFLDLGGHSLTAMQVISRIGESFRVELSMSEFFSGLCIAELVERILRGRQQTTPTPARVERNGALPVSFTQERLWLLNQLHPDSDAYHMPIAFRVQGSLNRLALERALNELIRRHEILRTVYAFSNDLVQTVLPDSPIQLPMTDLSLGVAGQLEGKLRQVYEAEARGPFDLATGLLMRARLVRLEESGHALLTVFHHIVSDGWSLNLFFKELSFYYDCFASRGELRSLPALGLQYADYAQWQRHYVRGIGLQEDLAYWKNHLLGAPEEVRWPSINASVEPGYNKAVRCAFTIPAKTVQGATILAQAHRLTPFMVLLTSLAITLYKWSEQDDMVIGTVVAGRNRREWERVLGCFMNFLNPNSRIDSLGPDARCAGGRF